MTQFHEIDFEDDTEAAGSGAFRMELDEDADPQSGTPFRIHVFSSSKYELFLSCQGRSKRISERHPVPGTGRASFVFAKSASVSAEEFAYQWIGTAHAPVFHDGEAVTLAEEIPAGLCDYDTVSYADLVEVEVTEDVSALLITGRNADGETGSLTVTYPVEATPDSCGAFSAAIESPEVLAPGAYPVVIATYGPRPIALEAGAFFNWDNTISEHIVNERVEFSDGWATVSKPIKQGPCNVHTVSAGIDDFGEFETETKEVYVQQLADLGIRGRGVVADVSYYTEKHVFTGSVPGDWFSTQFPVRFFFERCAPKDMDFPIEILVAGPPKDILVRWLDRDSQEPIEGGAVSIGLNGGALEFKGNTDENGELPILAVPTGTHTIVCVKAGYKRSDEDSMAQNDTFTVTVD